MTGTCAACAPAGPAHTAAAVAHAAPAVDVLPSLPRPRILSLATCLHHACGVTVRVCRQQRNGDRAPVSAVCTVMHGFRKLLRLHPTHRSLAVLHGGFTCCRTKRMARRRSSSPPHTRFHTLTCVSMVLTEPHCAEHMFTIAGVHTHYRWSATNPCQPCFHRIRTGTGRSDPFRVYPHRNRPFRSISCVMPSPGGHLLWV